MDLKGDDDEGSGQYPGLNRESLLGEAGADQFSNARIYVCLVTTVHWHRGKETMIDDGSILVSILCKEEKRPDMGDLDRKVYAMQLSQSIFSCHILIRMYREILDISRD